MTHRLTIAITVLHVISHTVPKIFLITTQKSVMAFSKSWLFFLAEF